MLPDLQNTRDGGLQCVTRLAESTWDWAQTCMVVQSFDKQSAPFYLIWEGGLEGVFVCFLLVVVLFWGGRGLCVCFVFVFLFVVVFERGDTIWLS